MKIIISIYFSILTQNHIPYKFTNHINKPSLTYPKLKNKKLTNLTTQFINLQINNKYKTYLNF